MQVQQFMTKTVEFVSPTTTLAEAATLMRELDVGVLPVGDGGRATGMLTDRDIVVRAIAENRDPAQTRVGEVVTPRVCTVYADQDVEDAANLMSREQVRRLLVIDRDQRPVGIVSLGDLSRGQAGDAAEVALDGITQPEHVSERKMSHP